MSPYTDRLLVSADTARGASSPSNREFHAALSRMLIRAFDYGMIPSRPTLVVSGDALARARAREFGRRIENGGRTTARHSIDLEVTEILRTVLKELPFETATVGVCTGAMPAALRTSAELFVDIRPSGPADWSIELAIAHKGEPSLGPWLISSLHIRSVLGEDLASHRLAFREDNSTGARVATDPGGGAGWVGGSSAPTRQRDLVAALTQSAQRALDDAGVLPGPGVPVLSAGQFTDGPSPSPGTEGFGLPDHLLLRGPDNAGTVRVPVTNVSHACASIMFAVELATRMLTQHSVNHVVVVGATLANPAAETSMEVVRALTPTSHARPFHPERDGITLGSGMGALVLSRLGDEGTAVSIRGAGKRGVARLLGIASRVSAPTAACQAEVDVLATMRSVLGNASADSHWLPEAVVAHATGTPAGDPVEVRALESLRAERQDPEAASQSPGLPVVSHKGATGHLLHASGLLGLAHGISLLGANSFTGTAGLEEDLGQGGLRILAEGSTHHAQQPLRSVMVNAMGFGGNTASALLGPA